MIVISREARVKLAKHAWNVYPLEAFGYLLGNPDQQEILAALPCSKTSAREGFGDRWNGLADSFEIARRTAGDFQLDVIGLYGSTQDNLHPDLPYSELARLPALPLCLIYGTICCPQCSPTSLYWHNQQLVRNEGYRQCKGPRLRPEVNQRRVHQRWLRNFGPIDYSNGTPS